MHTRNHEAPPCQEALDEILLARCEERTLAASAAQHLNTCDGCRAAADQLEAVSPGPETLAMLVLMRGVST